MLMSGGSEALVGGFCYLDRNRKAAASSAPSLDAKLHNTDAAYYFVVHPSQYAFAVLLQSLLWEKHLNCDQKQADEVFLY